VKWIVPLAAIPITTAKFLSAGHGRKRHDGVVGERGDSSRIVHYRNDRLAAAGSLKYLTD